MPFTIEKSSKIKSIVHIIIWDSLGKYTIHMDPIRYEKKLKATLEINLLRWRSFEGPWRAVAGARAA